MMFGKVTWFSPEIGFGFIRPEMGGADVLVLGGAVCRAGLNTLLSGQRLSYDSSYNEDDGRMSAITLQTA